MSHIENSDILVDDQTTMRRLGFAVLAMCVGALGIVALAIIVGQLH
jgi:hypothetical protein